jgi:hypothetical protein
VPSSQTWAEAPHGSGPSLYLAAMPRFDLTEEERALVEGAREYVRTQPYPLAPRLAPLKAALAKLAPADELSGPSRITVMDDPLKITGVLLSVLLPAIAGLMSWGTRGFIAGSLAGITLAFGVLRAVRTPIDVGRPFDPIPLGDANVRLDR